MKTAVLGPGQASQYVGMGKEFYDNYDEVKKIFKLASEIAKINVEKLCFEGPEAELTRTDNVQVCLTAVSVSALSVLKKETSIPMDAAAGHSLGEYTALYAAGVLDMEQVFKAVAARGQAMNEAASQCSGGMLAVINGKLDDIENTVNKLESDGVIQIANLNSEKQVILSGEKPLLDEAGKILKDLGCRKVIPLNVSGPWHSSFMKPASEKMESFLQDIPVKKAQIPVFSNVSAECYPTDPETIKSLLIRQITSPVNWLKEIMNMKDESIDTMIELAPNKVLQGIIRKIDKTIKVISFNSPEDIAEINKLTE